MWKQQRVLSTYVIVRITGNSTERFLNMCRHKKIYLWNIKEKDKGITACISRKDFLRLKDTVRKTGVHIKIIKKKGIRFSMFKYRKHYSFVAGICIAAIMLYVCSIFMWDISFEGNSEYTDSMLLRYLISSGIRPGQLISSINCDLIESEMRKEYDDITWVSAEIRGTRLIIHIKENDGAASLDSMQSDNPRDIIATESGNVVSIVTRKGTPLVKPGDAVEKGQILVSGIVPVYDDSATEISRNYTAADSDIIIRTTIEYDELLPEEYEYKEYTGNVQEKWIAGTVNEQVEVGLPLPKFKRYDTLTNTDTMKLTESFYLPFILGTKKYMEYNMKTAVYSDEEAQKTLNDKFYAYIKHLLQNKVQIIDNSVKMEKEGDCYEMKGILTVNIPAYSYADITETQNRENEEEIINERN